MRAIVQRVQNASVTVDDLVISAIGSGIIAWVGFGAQDNNDDLNYMVHTLLTTRFFHAEHSSQRWTRSVADCDYELLILSQISLCSTVYMEKPFFYQAMAARRSKSFYDRFIKTLKRRYKPDKIREGRFGAGYSVSTQSRGPIFIVESPYNPPQTPYMGPPPPYPYKPPQMYGGPPPARGASVYGGAPSYYQGAPQSYGDTPHFYGNVPPQGNPSSYVGAPSYGGPGRQPQVPIYSQYPSNNSYHSLPPLRPYPDYPNY